MYTHSSVKKITVDPVLRMDIDLLFSIITTDHLKVATNQEKRFISLTVWRG